MENYEPTNVLIFKLVGVTLELVAGDPAEEEVPTAAVILKTPLELAAA